MINRWLYWLNYLILAVIAILCVSMIYIWIAHTDEIAIVDPKSKLSGLPKGSFELPPSAYEGIAGSFLALESAPPSLQIPDLKSQLAYNGRNGRPDSNSENTVLHFTLSGNKKLTVKPEQKTYLEFEKNSKPARYSLSPNNEKTSLCFECSLQDNNEILVRVTMEDEKGEKVTEPEAFTQFRIPEKDLARVTGEVWEIGTWRVDGTLLARQRARWFGHDRFLEKHGGKSYENISNKQRIDFGENDEIYYVFIQTGDCLIWDDNHWRVIEPGPESLKHPLLVVKKIDDRLMSLELWDVDGKAKIPINLLKSTEPWTANNAQSIQQAFKFVGARTRTQCLFEINKERMVLKPSDWLLMTPKGWRKLDKEDEIDQYVHRKLSGMLFVFEGWTKKEDRQVMQGILYNPSRSEYQTVELAVQQASAKAPTKIAKEKELDEDASDAEELIERMISSLSQGKDAAKDKKKAPSKPNSSATKTLPPLPKHQRAKK
jgi:hypothetical protein